MSEHSYGCGLYVATDPKYPASLYPVGVCDCGLEQLGANVLAARTHAARWKALARELWHYRKEAQRSQAAFVDQVQANATLTTSRDQLQASLHSLKVDFEGVQGEVERLRGELTECKRDLTLRDNYNRAAHTHNERLRAVLRRYAQHDEACVLAGIRDRVTTDCTCGLDAALGEG